MLFQPVITTFRRISVTWMLSVLGVVQGGEYITSSCIPPSEKTDGVRTRTPRPFRENAHQHLKAAQAADVCVNLEKIYLKTLLSLVQTNKNLNLSLTSTIICWRELRCKRRT